MFLRGTRTSAASSGTERQVSWRATLVPPAPPTSARPAPPDAFPVGPRGARRLRPGKLQRGEQRDRHALDHQHVDDLLRRCRAARRAGARPTCARERGTGGAAPRRGRAPRGGPRTTGGGRAAVGGPRCAHSCWQEWPRIIPAGSCGPLLANFFPLENY